MSNKIVVPEGMLQAGRSVYSGYVTAEEGARRIIEAALRWLSDRPIVPNMNQATYLRDLSITESRKYYNNQATCASETAVVLEWQRRMFIAPEPEVPECPTGCTSPEQIDACLQWASAEGHINIREMLSELKQWRAFRRSQKAGAK